MVKKEWILVAAIALILLFLSKSNFFVMNVMKFFVDNFATGRSDFKVVLFLIFLMVMSLLLAFYSYVKNIKLMRRLLSIKMLPLVLFLLLFLGFLAGVCSYIYYIHHFGLDYNHYYLSVYDGKLSSTQFSHIHTSKGVLSKLSEIFGLSMHQTYDEGLFYEHYIPMGFAYFFMLLMPIVFMLICVCLLQLYGHLEAHTYRNFYVFLYIISSLSSFKNVIDGGLFNPETLFWFSVFAVMLFCLYKQFSFEVRGFFIRVMIVSGVVYIAILPFYVIYWENFNFLFSRYLLFTLFLFLVYFMFRSTSEQKWHIAIIVFLSYILIVFLIAFLLGNGLVHYALDADYEMTRPVVEGSDAYLYIPAGQDTKGCDDVIYSENDFSVCHFVVRYNTSILHLLNKDSLLPVNYNPLLVHNVTCDKNTVNIEFGTILLLNGTVPVGIETPIMVVNFTPMNVRDDFFQNSPYFSYQYEVHYFGCLPSFYEVMYRIFNKNGLPAFIVG